MKGSQHSRPHGSVYLVTIITVAAVVSMVLIGVRLRTASNTKSALIEHMAKANGSALDATEYALHVIAEDSQWNTTAQTGTIFNDFSLGDTAYSGTVIDADTSSVPTDATTAYRLEMTAISSMVTNKARVDIHNTKTDYATVLSDLGATHYWPLNETLGPVYAIDVIGGHDGEYISPEIAGAGTNDEGGIVPVFADDDDYILVPWGDDFTQSNGSISLWMQTTGNQKLEYYGLFGMLYSEGRYPSISLSLWGSMLIANISDTGSRAAGNYIYTPVDSVNAGDWIHVVTTWGSDSFRLYIGGVEVGSKIAVKDGLATAKVNKGGEQPLRIGGGYVVALNKVTAAKFIGSTAHIAFVPAALTAKQINELAAIKPDLSTLEIVPNTWAKVYE